MSDAMHTSDAASYLLSFLRIGKPAVLLDTTGVDWLTGLGFGPYLPGNHHDDFSYEVPTVPAASVAHRLTRESVELVDPAGQVLGRWTSPQSRVWSVVATPPVPMWVAFFAVSESVSGIGPATEESAFRSLVSSGRVIGGHVAPRITTAGP